MATTDAARLQTAPVLVIEPGAADKHYWADMWRFRELFLILAWRDVSVRYKQTIVGAAWAILQPFLTMLVFTVVFGRIAKLPSEGAAPYPLMVFAGMMPWYLFASGLAGAAESMLANTNLISKVYFPRMIIPAAAIVTGIVDFAVNVVVLAALMAWYRFAPTWNLLALPLFVALAMGASFGLGLLMATLNTKYRDFRYVIPFLLQFGLYVSPVGFSTSVVPEPWRALYSLNPMVGIIDGFRWCVLGGERPPDAMSLALAVAMVALAAWMGIRFFRKTEKAFADLV